MLTDILGQFRNTLRISNVLSIKNTDLHVVKIRLVLFESSQLGRGCEFFKIIFLILFVRNCERRSISKLGLEIFDLHALFGLAVAVGSHCDVYVLVGN